MAYKIEELVSPDGYYIRLPDLYERFENAQKAKQEMRQKGEYGKLRIVKLIRVDYGPHGSEYLPVDDWS